MSDSNKKYLDLQGLQAYDNFVKQALAKKENEKYIGSEEPTDEGVTVWFDTSGDQNGVSAFSLRPTANDEQLTFNNIPDSEELTFNDGNQTSDEEELTFNEIPEDEELIFNE